MVNIDQPVVSDTSHMLRDILQTKDIRFQELEKQQVTHIMENEKVISPVDVNDEHPGRSDQESVGGSDEESSFMEQGRVDEGEVDDLKSDGEENCSNDMNSTSDINEAKRARVDNIISSMQHPAQFMDAESLYNNDVRRQKRKQNIPQQHESIPKIRKLDTNPSEEHLWNLRNQLFAVQNYFKQQQEENLHKQLNGFPAMENIQRLHQAYFANLSARHTERVPSPPPPKAPMFSFKDSKITGDHFNIAEHVRESVNANKVGDLDDKELNELIANLKSKIEEAVSVTVDKELAKFFQKRKPKEVEPQIDRHLKEERIENHEIRKIEPERKPTNHSLDHILQLPEKTNNHNGFRVPERQSAFELPKLGGGIPEIPRPPFPHHPPLAYPPLSFYLPSNLHPPSLYSGPIVPPEQTEALSLVVSTPKKKRTKVTDTRLSPRAARALLNDNGTLSSMFDHERPLSAAGLGHLNHCLPTSVAIPNPSLQHSDIMSFYREQALCGSPTDNGRNTPCSSNSPSDGGYGSYLKNEFFNDSDSFDSQGKQIMDTLTPMHLRKAKLMFFYVRYPSSAILKVYFPDVQFNKNNTAQLVKWFSNFRKSPESEAFRSAQSDLDRYLNTTNEARDISKHFMRADREFYYIQMEKYARQAIAEGCKHAEELVVTTDSELYRVLNLHYNRNNQIDVPENFRLTVQATLREFFNAIMSTKDSEPSWKKPIYKVIARLDDAIPEYFKSPNWMDQLGEA